MAADPSSARVTYRHRVAFYETDAMGVVHHANYVHFLELARIRFMDEHLRPYKEFVESGRHFAVTAVELSYKRAAAYDDRLDVEVWVEWARGASLRMAYRIGCEGALIATAATEHAFVDETGRPRRIPREDRDAFARLAEGAS